MLQTDAKTRALYLNNALDYGTADDVANVLQSLREAERTKVRSIDGGRHMHLAEILDILEHAGLRLVAIPNRQEMAEARFGDRKNS